MPELERVPDSVQVGEWIIKPGHPGKVWIERAGDGEAMECDEAVLAEAIGKFYEEHF